MSGSLALPGTAVGRRGFMGFPRSLVYGFMGGFMLFAVYMAIVAGASGSFGHFLDQARTDWYFIAPLMAGFGIQVGLLAELRRRKKLQALAAGVGVGGAGASTVGMIACCAHHIADLAPFLGASAAATFLTTYKLWFVLAGLGVNAVGIVLMARRLRALPAPAAAIDSETCKAA